jgi:hypothetical protein
VKNKKLFAILTLVCFMFTLMPVAAFAAESYPYDADQVYVGATAAPVLSADEDGIELDLTLSDVKVGVGFKAFVGDALDNTKTTTDSYVFYVADEDGDIIDVNRGGVFSGIRAAGDNKFRYL